MKRKIWISIALCAALSTVAFARGGQAGGSQNTQATPTQISVSAVVANLTEEQKEDLLFMYQEEKVARDAYITLGNLWGERVFLNIQKAEQKHMDAIRSLLEKYALPIPVTDDTIGVFENEELQVLYDELVEMGSVSSEDALNVGVLIEETDIADLEEKIVGAPDDIVAVYSNLLQGSYNHLDAFTRALSGSGAASGGQQGRRGR
jgi:hypothetical protein